MWKALFPPALWETLGCSLSPWELLKIAVFPKVRCCWIGFDFGVVRARINKMVTSNCVFKTLISFQVFCLIILSRLREGKN